MENNIRAYQLARKLHRHTNTLNHSQQLLHHTLINKSMTYQQPPILNIFKDNTELRIRKLQIQKDREYEITGAGAVLKINHIKNKKKKDAKNRNSQEKKTLVTNQSSRQSLTPFAGSIYLTKDEVLDLQSKSSNGMRSVQQRSELYCPLKRYNLTESDKQNKTSNFSPNQALTHNKSKNFSVSKLKQRLLQYKASWDRQESRRKQEQQTKGHNLKRKRMTKLSKRQRGDRYSNKMHNIFESTLSWELNLRQESEKQRQQTSVLMCQQNGLSLEGRSKLKKQRLWVQQKHSKGYFFYRSNSINSSQIYRQG